MSSNDKTTVQRLENGVYRITTANRSAVSGRFVIGQSPKVNGSLRSTKDSPSSAAATATATATRKYA